MKTWLIYKHTNKITGKSYIGQTCYSMAARWHKHCYSANKKPEGYFHKAIAKYGTDVWESVVLECDIPTIELANVAEIRWIAEYDTVNNGYNLCIGGDSIECTDKVKQLMREGSRNYHGTKEVRMRNVFTEEVFEGFASDLARTKGYEVSSFSDVIAGKSRSYKGWVLDTDKNISYQPIVRHWFWHDEYGVVYKSLDEMCREFKNITSRGNLSCVIYKTRKSHQGWKLLERVNITSESNGGK